MSWERLGVEFLFCFLCVAAMLFVQLEFLLGLSLACLVGLLILLKWDVCSCVDVAFLAQLLFFRACRWPAWSGCCFP